MTVENQYFNPERYKIIPRVLIFSTREDKLLLIKGSPDKKLWPNLYNGIGGHVEKGENILSAAKREFYEETGLELLDPQLSVVVTIDTGKTVGICMFVFIGNAGEGALLPSTEGDLYWVDLFSIDSLPMVEDLETLLPNVLNKDKSSPILYAQYSYNNSGILIEFDGGN